MCILYLVGGIPTPLKNTSLSVGMMTFPTEWKVIKFMFQTSNQNQPESYIIHDFPMIIPLWWRFFSSVPRYSSSCRCRWSSSASTFDHHFHCRTLPAENGKPICCRVTFRPLSPLPRDKSLQPAKWHLQGFSRPLGCPITRPCWGQTLPSGITNVENL